MNECKDDLEFLLHQFERVASDLEALRNDLGVLSALMMRQAERLNGSKKKKAAA
jgi:hypothetical protein